MSQDARDLTPLQATVHAFDEATGDGEVIGDDGVVLPFAAAAWLGADIRLLRVGQRVRLLTSGADDPRVVTLTLW